MNSKTVYIVDRSQDPYIQTLLRELRRYQITARLINRIDEISGHLESSNPIGIVLGDLVSLGELPEVKPMCFNVPVILARTEDSPKLRLLGARYNVDGIYTKPVDTIRLINQLDQISYARGHEIPDRVLLAISNKGNREYHRKNLEAKGIQVHIVETAEGIISYLHREAIDLIIVEKELGDWTGVEIVTMIRHHDLYSWIPVIILADSIDHASRLQAIRNGPAAIFPRYAIGDNIVSAIRGDIYRSRLLKGHVLSDSLTSLYTGLAIDHFLEGNVNRASQYGTGLSFCLLELDHFNEALVNGVEFGDRLLIEFAVQLKSSVSDLSLVGRYKRSQYAVIMPRHTGQQTDTLINDFRVLWDGFKILTPDSTEFKITFSCGIVEWKAGYTTSVMLELANQALLDAIKSGRDRNIIIT